MYNNFGVKLAKILKSMEEERYNLKHPFVGSEHLLLALLKHDKKVKEVFVREGITYTVLKKELIKVVGTPKNNTEYNLYTPLLKRIINNSIEDAEEYKDGIVTSEGLVCSLIEEGEGVAIRILVSLGVDLDNIFDDLSADMKLLDKEDISFGIDLTKIVRMDEVLVGRDKEIDYIIETLLRKKKNNPILLGDAGVGKTAIIEELSRRIVNDNVPSQLINARIISLEMSDLISGTKYRGEFEEKLNKIINTLVSHKNIILFIDEIHTMVSAGGAEGAISAGDILKPYLARGEIKCIGATTIEEYDKYISKDKALCRRFESVIIKEPSLDETINILSKIKGEYEKYHNVKITQDNIEKIASITSKYIQNKKNPDKSIDFLDSVSSYVNLKNIVATKNMKDAKMKEQLIKEKEDLIKENNFKDAILKLEEIKKLDKTKTTQKKSLLITNEDIMKVLESKTSIPHSSKAALIQSLKVKLKDNDFLPAEAKDAYLNLIKNKLNNIDEKLMLLIEGVEKTGKTTLLTITKEVFNSVNYIKLNGSDFMSDTSVTKLIGTTKGYVGYNEPSLFDKVKHNPFSIIEIENYDKLSPAVKSLFKQIKDTGVITDSKNDEINFQNTIIIATSRTQDKGRIGLIDNKKSIEENPIFTNVIKLSKKNVTLT